MHMHVFVIMRLPLSYVHVISLDLRWSFWNFLRVHRSELISNCKQLGLISVQSIGCAQSVGTKD
jgi:hypothetical protein